MAGEGESLALKKRRRNCQKKRRGKRPNAVRPDTEKGKWHLGHKREKVGSMKHSGGKKLWNTTRVGESQG